MSGVRKGWCPGALKPMRTGDGLLVRVRLTGGVLTPDLAAALAEAARSFGNGLLDLSARANLQFRGVQDQTLQPLLDRLSELGVLDDSAEAEQVRNVLASPLAGLDATALIDVAPLARELERRLTGDQRYHALPAKFGFLVDGGGALSLEGVGADIGLRAISSEAFRLTADTADLGVVSKDGAIDAALKAAERFLQLRRPEERRMREVAHRLLDQASGPLSRFAQKAVSRLAGPYDTFFAAAAPFGRLDAAQLLGLAGQARSYDLELRLTPWRAILLAGRARQPAELGEEVAALGLVTDPSDPRLAIAACPGRPSCLSGEAPAQADAARLAPALAPYIRAGASVHVSGCAKGCARRAPASITLVGEAGRYAVAFEADSKAASPWPAMEADEIAAFLAKNPWQNSSKSRTHV